MNRIRAFLSVWFSSRRVFYTNQCDETTAAAKISFCKYPQVVFGGSPPYFTFFPPLVPTSFFSFFPSLPSNSRTEHFGSRVSRPDIQDAHLTFRWTPTLGQRRSSIVSRITTYYEPTLAFSLAHASNLALTHTSILTLTLTSNLAFTHTSNLAFTLTTNPAFTHTNNLAFAHTTNHLLTHTYNHTHSHTQTKHFRMKRTLNYLSNPDDKESSLHMGFPLNLEPLVGFMSSHCFCKFNCIVIITLGSMFSHYFLRVNCTPIIISQNSVINDSNLLFPIHKLSFSSPITWITDYLLTNSSLHAYYGNSPTIHIQISTYCIHFQLVNTNTSFSLVIDKPPLFLLTKHKMDLNDFICCVILQNCPIQTTQQITSNFPLTRPFSKDLLKAWNRNQIKILSTNINSPTNIKTWDKNCWKFNPKLLSGICRRFTLMAPDIDTFADSNNALCDLFCSKFSNPLALPLDAFSCISSYTDECLWINPPYQTHSIILTLKSILASSSHGWLCLPNWISSNSRIAPLFSSLLNRSSHCFHIHKNQNIFFPRAQNYSSSRFPPPWDVLLIHFSSNPNPCDCNMITINKSLLSHLLHTSPNPPAVRNPNPSLPLTLKNSNRKTSRKLHSHSHSFRFTLSLTIKPSIVKSLLHSPPSQIDPFIINTHFFPQTTSSRAYIHVRYLTSLPSQKTSKSTFLNSLNKWLLYIQKASQAFLQTIPKHPHYSQSVTLPDRHHYPSKTTICHRSSQSVPPSLNAPNYSIPLNTLPLPSSNPLTQSSLSLFLSWNINGFRNRINTLKHIIPKNKTGTCICLQRT